MGDRRPTGGEFARGVEGKRTARTPRAVKMPQNMGDRRVAEAKPSGMLAGKRMARTLRSAKMPQNIEDRRVAGGEAARDVGGKRDVTGGGRDEFVKDASGKRTARTSRSEKCRNVWEIGDWQGQNS